MTAVVWHGVGDIRLDNVREPKIEQPTDAIVRSTASAICGTDLHFVRGTFAGMEQGITLGHEAVGVVAEVGKSGRRPATGVDHGRPQAGGLTPRPTSHRAPALSAGPNTHA